MYVYVYRKYTIGELPNSEEQGIPQHTTYKIKHTHMYICICACVCMCMYYVCMYEVQYGLTFQTVHFAKS